MEYEKVKIKLGEDEFDLLVDFGSAKDFADNIKDPSIILNGFLKGDESFLTLDNLVKSLQVSLASAGVKKTQDEIGKAMYRHGQKLELTEKLAEYITLLATSGKGFGKKKEESKTQPPPVPQQLKSSSVKPSELV